MNTTTTATITPAPNLHHLLPSTSQPDPNPNPNREVVVFYGPKPKPKPKPRKKPDPLSAPPKTTTTSTATVAAAIPPCTECGKRFSSWKALFGHMRCHPERTWRGINPPPQFPRRQIPDGTHFTAEEYEVASSLILLASGPHGTCGRGKKRAWEESAAAHDSVCGGGGGGGDHNHTCGVCLRGFSSGQALGGHMRCHWETTSSNVGATTNSAIILKDFGLDLNFPPPLEGNEGRVVDNGGDDDGTDGVLDLRLGM